MKSFRIILGLLLLSIDLSSAASLTYAAYEEVEELYASCRHALDNCKSPRYNDSLQDFNCLCDSSCAQLSTCCIDSPYRQLKPTLPVPACRFYSENSLPVFMVDKCPVGNALNHSFKEKCESEWSDVNRDLGLLIPVTSLLTNITYKNYHCFRCHEEHEKYRSWDVRAFPNQKHDNTDNCTDTVPTYSSADKMWMAPLGESCALIPVHLEIAVPLKVQELMIRVCLPDVVSICSSNWIDDDVTRKCKEYMSLVQFSAHSGSETKDVTKLVTYRNPHCALCNFENLEDMHCPLPAVSSEDARSAPRRVSRSGSKPFPLLTDLNSRIIPGSNERCSNGEIWDEVFGKCKSVVCAINGYVIRNGKCSPA